jgi:hypothetical protein
VIAVRLLLPAGQPKRWHGALFDRLVADGARVSVDFVPPAPRRGDVAALESLERLLFARDPAAPGAALDAGLTQNWPRAGAQDADLTLDLSGAHDPPEGVVAPFYDGAPGEAARDAALLAGRAPLIQLAAREGATLRLHAEGRPAFERPWLYVDGLDAVAGRLALLAREAARRTDAAETPTAAPAPCRPRSGAFGFATRGLARRVAARIARHLSSEHHWRIGLRACGPGAGVMDRLGWPDAAWSWLPDDRRRYYADPFFFAHEGTTYLFCEEYPYATGKGVISVATLDAQGRASTPRVVLERPYHLSYPFVFRHAGEIWMTPESCAADALELYRAVDFPSRWTLERRMIDGVAISDATIFPHQGRFWVTATTCEQGSSWDCLSLFVGDSPLGPFTRCGDAPAMIDAAAARPAGPVQHIDGALWRPAQDCVDGYGAGLALCRIDRLDEDGFAQTVAARLRPPPGAPGAGVHTLSRGEGFEAIDALDAPALLRRTP